METAPRNCRFLSLVVVKLVLTKVEKKQTRKIGEGGFVRDGFR